MTKIKNIITSLKQYTHISSFILPMFILPMVVSTDTASSSISVRALNLGDVKVVEILPEVKSDDKKELDSRAAKIDAYFAKANLPLSGYGYAFVETADKYNLDYRLLPAIAMRESTGGKFACYNDMHNVFGWASCKQTFESYEHSIDKVGAHLAGEIKSTAGYYKNKTIPQKLKRYNSVIPAYTSEIYSIMGKIESIKLV